MKKILVVILAFAMIFSFTACADKKAKNPDVSEIMNAVKKDIKFEDMADIEKEKIKTYIDINLDEVEQLKYIIAGDGITADEVLIVKVKDGTDTSDIKSKIEKSRENKKELFKSYSPEEMPKIESSVLEIKGNYVFYAITSDNSKAKKIFNDAV